MMAGWIAVLIAIAYIGALFLVAWFGDRRAEGMMSSARPGLYALALSVYCTSWTFFGSVGVSSRDGWDFLPIYIGPILMFTLGYPILRRVIRISKTERITSVADFLGARYGKSQYVAVATTLIVIIGAIPYIALQLKAIAGSVSAIIPGTGSDIFFPVLGDTALLVACGLALFAVLFGTRHADATEHQHGMVLAVAVEAVVKLIAFLLVGGYVTWILYGGIGDLVSRAAEMPEFAEKFTRDLPGGSWLAMTALAFFACLLLPRQFHIAVVENNSPEEVRRAAWLFPLYLVAINLFVVPIAVAGHLRFGGALDPDFYVLEIPYRAGNDLVTIAAFLGGLSAATAMVIVETVAIGIMISNEIVVPAMLRGRSRSWLPADMGGFILNVRRSSIILVLFLGYAYYRVAGTAALASIGLLSFAAIAQLAPAFFGGLVWRRATARGAAAGMVVGMAVWFYTLLLPTFVEAGYFGRAILEQGPFGLSALRPQALFWIAFEPLTHGVFWSLLANVAVYVGLSLSRAPRSIERLQANVFIPQETAPSPVLRPVGTGVRVGELYETVARYLGAERSRRSFESFGRQWQRELDPKAIADLNILRFSEQLLASAIGAASARLVLSLLLDRDDPSPARAQRLLDDAEQALHYNRDLLQSVLNRADQGIAVFDSELRLICWNRPFRNHLDLPQEFGQVGISLRDIMRRLAEAGLFGAGDPAKVADAAMSELIDRRRPFQERHPATGRILTVEPRAMGEVGLAFVVTDITERAESEAELVQSKALLEKRVEERTQELVRLNAALERATAAAEEANIGKTRFLAAASHDILQPLNAARLYATSLSERLDGTASATLSHDLERSLDSVEEIFRAVLEISRLDTETFRPEIRAFAVQELLDRVRVEFEQEARAKGIDLRVVSSSALIRSDPRLVSRLLANLVSNALKYTPVGCVLVGCRRRGRMIQIDVIDTGMGISSDDQRRIFREFQRLDAGARMAPGLGLGLSIVERITKVLDLPLRIASEPGRGTRITIEIPAAIGRLAAEPPAEAAPSVAAASVTGMVVLSIDNDEKILAGMRALLEGWSAHPITARSAREALRLLHEAGREPEIMLVDYHLEDGNGLAAIAEIRWKLGQEIPAILITADRSPELREKAASAGVRILNKPLKPAALRALMAVYTVRRAAAE